MGFDSMSGIIKELAAQMMEECGFETPADINNGDCGEFADLLLRALGEDSDAKLCIVPLVAIAEALDGHVWVFLDGRHYDSETPDGVEDWRHLPFYQRNYRRLFATNNKGWLFFRLPLSLVPSPIVADEDVVYHRG